MSRPEGLPKTGGRQKGTPNKRTEKFTEILIEKNFEPLSEILALLTELTPRERVATLISLLPYKYPKFKAIDQPFEPASLDGYLDIGGISF